MSERDEREIVFIGKIISGMTHELKNVLASIKEMAGLMEDLMLVSADKPFAHREKFEEVLPKIKQQIKRGNELNQKLNKFSHIINKGKAEIELNEIIEVMVFLYNRFTKLQNVELSFPPADINILITVEPAKLLILMQNCIEYFLHNSNEKGEILINLTRDKDEVSITVSYKYEKIENVKFFENEIDSKHLKNINETVISIGAFVEYNEIVPLIKIIL